MRWKEQIELMDDIKAAVYLQALAHRDPVLAYKQEAHASFVEMKLNVCEGVLKNFAIIVAAKRKAEERIC